MLLRSTVLTEPSTIQHENKHVTNHPETVDPNRTRQWAGDCMKILNNAQLSTEVDFETGEILSLRVFA